MLSLHAGTGLKEGCQGVLDRSKSGLFKSGHDLDGPKFDAFWIKG
jgi:hypothetical protein